MTDQSSTTATTTTYASVWPSISFTDVDAGVRLLTEGFGLTVTALYRDEQGTIVHAEARSDGGGGLMFGSRGKTGDWGTLGPAGVYLVGADAAVVDAAYQRVGALPGVQVIQHLHDTDYGSHEFGVRDGDGNLWSMGTYRGE